MAAACGTFAAASSLIAKLALGGAKWEDFDPAVHGSAAPFFAVAAKVWDQPYFRPGFIRAWRAVVRDVQAHGEK